MKYNLYVIPDLAYQRWAVFSGKLLLTVLSQTDFSHLVIHSFTVQISNKQFITQMGEKEADVFFKELL